MKNNLINYFFDIANVESSKSTCIRRKVGAILVKNNMIISTGFNGTPINLKNCDKGGCLRCKSNVKTSLKLNECNCVHAEANAIIQAAFHGISTKDSILITTLSPCLSCSKLIINAGIKEIFYKLEYKQILPSLIMLKSAKLKVKKITKGRKKINFKT